MSLVLALFLIVHGGIHIGYICGPAWPFVDADPWLVTVVGVGPETVRGLGIALVLVTFVGYLLVALTAMGLLPSRLWTSLVVIASVASAAVLTIFVTPWTLPGLAIDAVLVWAVLGLGWRPTPFVGSSRTRRSEPGVQPR